LVTHPADSPHTYQGTHLNVSALLRLTHAALAHLVAAARLQPRGVADLVNISSVAGRQAIGGAAKIAETSAHAQH
jgi:short-subunit dehydrogenase